MNPSIPSRALLTLVVSLIASPLPLGAQSVAAATFAPGGQQIYLLDFSTSPLGAPSGLSILQGQLDVVDKDGTRMLRASTRAAFVVRLPSRLPTDFTLEFDIVPKMCCSPEDLAFEGTTAITQNDGSAHILWHRDYQQIVGGGGHYDRPMPPALSAVVPGTLTNVAVAVQGTTIRMFTNGQLVYTLDRLFARGQVLRVFLGGQNDSDQAVYLARMRVGVGPPLATAILVPGPTGTAMTSPATPAVQAPTAATGGPVRAGTWNGVKSFNLAGFTATGASALAPRTFTLAAIIAAGGAPIGSKSFKTPGFTATGGGSIAPKTFNLAGLTAAGGVSPAPRTFNLPGWTASGSDQRTP